MKTHIHRPVRHAHPSHETSGALMLLAAQARRRADIASLRATAAAVQEPVHWLPGRLSRVLQSLASVPALWAFAAMVQAAPVATYNTGQTNPAPGAVDPHYQLVFAMPPAPWPVQAQVLANKPAAWLPDVPGQSSWIGPGNDSAYYYGQSGIYVFETLFDLTGFDPTTAVFAGLFVGADGPVVPYVNGVLLGAGAYSFGNPSSAWGSFGFSGATVPLNAGQNSLRFHVHHLLLPAETSGPLGLRVQWVGEAQELPEPGSLALVGMAMLALARTRPVSAASRALRAGAHSSSTPGVRRGGTA